MIERFKTTLIQRLIEIADETNGKIVTLTRRRLRRARGASQLNALLREVRDLIGEDYQNILTILGEELGELAIQEAAFQARAISTVLPSGISGRAATEAAVNRIVSTSTIEGLTLSEAFTGVQAATLNGYRGSVRGAVIEGLGLTDVVNRLLVPGGPLGPAQGRLERLSRTAATSISAQARQAVFRRNPRIIRGVLWVATLDTRTCPVCGGLDGTTFDVDSGPRPPAHFSCRCVIVPVTRNADEFLTRAGPRSRASFNGVVPGGLTFEEWLRTQSAAIQDESLGPSRGQLFREGLAIDRFTANDLSPLTLDEIRQDAPDFFRRAGL